MTIGASGDRAERRVVATSKGMPGAPANARHRVKERMGTVLAFERKPKEEPAKAGVTPGPHYFCTKCDSDRFRVFASGDIRCGSCGARMRNLLASAL